MSISDAARKTVRRLSDRVDRRELYTMQFERQPDGSGFMNCYDMWLRIRDAGWPEAEQRAQLFAMQQHCLRHKIITAEELAVINTKYGVDPCPTSSAPTAP